jgi:hypothetical protein
MTTRLRLLVAAAGAALATLTLPAQAQTCFQKVGGVPGAYGQPPDWWSVGASPLGSMTNTFVDDPRWQGSTAVSHIGDAGRFRVLIDKVGTQRYLVASFRVKADASGNGDRLYFGVWDETTNRGNVFSLTKNIGSAATSTAGETYASSGFSGRFYNRIGAAGNTWGLNNAGASIPPPLPDWLKNDTRVDVFCPGGTCSEWAFRVRIPIDPAADVAVDNPTGVKITTGGVFRFWYQMQEESAVNTAVLYGWPSGLPVAEDVASPTCTGIPPYCFPDPLDATNPWLRVTDGATCDGDIALQPGQIYANTPGSITVNLTGANHFHARPLNNTTGVQPGNAVKATYRLANWGSTLFDSPEWTPICTDVVGTAGSIAAGSQFDIDCSYTVPDSCPYKPAGDPCGATAGTKNVDQCILVDLGSAPGSGPYFFSPQSAWQNMLFNGASTVKKVAHLDMRGQKPLPAPAPNRDLYVYIATNNLPAKRSPKDPPIDLQRLSGQAREQLAKLKIQLPEVGGIGKVAAAAIAEAFGRGALSFEDVSALMPTYAAYVWYDTGKTMQGSGGAMLKRLEPQPGFGTFLWHDGDLHGWRHQFEGSTITEIAPSYFRISAPTDGVVKANVTISACERENCDDLKPPTQPPTQPPTTPPTHESGWKLWLLLIVLLFLLMFLLRKKKP